MAILLGMRSHSLFALHRNAGALDDLNQALALLPNYPVYLGTALSLGGRGAQLLKDLRKVEKHG
jgi:hypothetical protein